MVFQTATQRRGERHFSTALRWTTLRVVLYNLKTTRSVVQLRPTAKTRGPQRDTGCVVERRRRYQGTLRNS